MTTQICLNCFGIDISSAGATYVMNTNVEVDTSCQVTAEFNDLVPNTGVTEVIGEGPCAYVKPLPKSKVISNSAKPPLGVKLKKRHKSKKLKTTTNATKKKSTLPVRRAVAKQKLPQ